jgi:hypothetical protein
MAFALSIITLEEAMKKSGCPVCRLEHQVAIHAVDSFLWENTNDSAARKPINDAYGFCPEHTQLLVATELSNSGPALGVNMIYELLAKNVYNDLKNFKRAEASRRFFNSLFRWFNPSVKQSPEQNVLPPKGICPICSLTNQ